ncbi:MAG: cell division ATPase MinD [Candidatus Aenigmatarchaeota archaeon]
MVRIIDICSGKGGVGKTTIVANLGITLQNLGKKVAVVDCNLTTSHLSLLFGIYSYPITLNSFLRNESRLEDAIYTHSSGLKIVPASLELKDLIDVDITGLKNKLKEVFSDFDIVLLDSAPGLGKEALIALQTADEILFVANPYIPSLIDIIKCSQLINSIESKPLALGIILNRVKKKRYEISSDEIRQFTELPIIGNIPEDENILESTNRKTLITVSKRNSPASRAFFEIAAKLVGVECKRPNLLNKFSRIFRRW